MRSSSHSFLDTYLTHLTVERRLARNTIESYARDLSILFDYATKQDSSVEMLTRSDLEKLVRDRMAQGRSPRSVARAVACFRGFYRFLVLDGSLSENPNSRDY